MEASPHHISRHVRVSHERNRLIVEHGPELLGETTGVDGIDRVIGRTLEPGRLVVVAGRPGTGKSSLATQAALHIAERGGQVVVWSGEMDGSSLVDRMAAQVSRTDLDAIAAGFRTADGSTDHDAYRRFEAGIHHLRDLPIEITTEPTSVDGIAIALARRSGTPSAPRLLVVDHLGLVSPSAEVRTAPRAVQVGHVTRTLKMLALEHGLAVLLVAQLNRTPSREAREPNETDLRDSGRIEEDADVVAFVHRRLDQLTDHTRDQALAIPGAADHLAPFLISDELALVYSTKNRSGKPSMALLRFIASQTRFADLDDPADAAYQRPAGYSATHEAARRKLTDLLRDLVE